MKRKNIKYITLWAIIFVILIIKFFSNFKWNCYKYLEIGLYSADCWKYWPCLKFNNIIELKNIHGKLSEKKGMVSFWLTPWEDIQNFNSLHSYYGGLKTKPTKKNAYYYSMILNQSGVVLIWDDLYTYNWDLGEYWEREKIAEYTKITNPTTKK